MTERGHVLERMTLVRTKDGLELEALYQRGVEHGPDRVRAMPVILAAPHPRLGGSMDAAVLAEIVWQLARQGHPTLRFNWRGIGASPGIASDDVAEAARDLGAAIDQHAAGAPCAVVGYSFGAAAAARVAVSHPLVERAILIALPVASYPVDFAALADSGTAVTLIAGADDTIAPLAALEIAVAGAFRVHTIPGAGHSFVAGLTALGRLVAESLPGTDNEIDAE